MAYIYYMYASVCNSAMLLAFSMGNIRGVPLFALNGSSVYSPRIVQHRLSMPICARQAVHILPQNAQSAGLALLCTRSPYRSVQGQRKTPLPP